LLNGLSRDDSPTKIYSSQVKIICLAPFSAHLEPGEAGELSKIARSKGISYVELIKEWVLEKTHVR
jgi:hypothetical protein